MKTEKERLDDDEDELVSTETVAYLCNITTRHLNRLSEQGIIPRRDRGLWHLSEASTAYIVYLHRKLGWGAREGVLSGADEGVREGVRVGRNNHGPPPNVQAELDRAAAAREKRLALAKAKAG
jgi:hypothetical protein